MFQQLFKRDETVRRHLAAPLPRSRSDYLAHRAEQGVQPRWLKATGGRADAAESPRDGAAVPARPAIASLECLLRVRAIADDLLERLPAAEETGPASQATAPAATATRIPPLPRAGGSRLGTARPGAAGTGRGPAGAADASRQRTAGGGSRR